MEKNIKFDIENNNQISFDEALKLLYASETNDLEDNKKNFDQYGNYIFPTNYKFFETNSLATIKK